MPNSSIGSGIQKAREKLEVAPLQPSIQNFPQLVGASNEQYNSSQSRPAKVYMPMNQAKFSPFAYRKQKQASQA